MCDLQFVLRVRRLSIASRRANESCKGSTSEVLDVRAYQCRDMWQQDCGHTLTRFGRSRQVLHQLPEKPKKRRTSDLIPEWRIPIKRIAKIAHKGEDLILSRGPEGMWQSACQVPVLRMRLEYRIERCNRICKFDRLHLRRDGKAQLRPCLEQAITPEGSSPGE